MKLFDKLGKAAQNSGKLFQKQVEDYIVVDPPAHALTLKAKTVELLCQKTIQRVDQLTALEPDLQQGLLATIEPNQIKAKIHFTPEKIYSGSHSDEVQVSCPSP